MALNLDRRDTVALHPAARSRTILEWFAGADPSIRCASAANRDELRARGAIIFGGIVLSASMWTTAGIVKFGLQPAVVAVTAAGALGLASFVMVIDRGNAVRALRQGGQELLGEGERGFSSRVRRAFVAGSRLGVAMLEAAATTVVLVPAAFFGAEIAAVEQDRYRTANQAVYQTAVERVDAVERALRDSLLRADGALKRVMDEGDAIRDLPQPQVQAVDAAEQARIRELAAARADAEHRALQHDMDRDAEQARVDGVQLRPNNTGRAGRGPAAIQAELRATEQRRIAELHAAEIVRLVEQADALRRAEASRVAEFLRIRSERQARYNAELKSTREERAEAERALYAATNDRSRMISEAARGDPRYMPQRRSGFAADLGTLLHLACNDIATTIISAVATLLLLSLLLLGPLTALAPLRLPYAARLADGDAAELEEIWAAAHERRARCRARSIVAGVVNEAFHSDSQRECTR